MANKNDEKLWEVANDKASQDTKPSGDEAHTAGGIHENQQDKGYRQRY